MNIVAYCRVSTEQDDQINSLNAQKVFFEEYANKNNHNLVKIYADEGISGTKIKKRTQFQTLMREANSGMFNMVVVKDISRFARNTVDFLQSIRTLKNLGIETQFITSNQTVIGNSEFGLTIFSAMAQEESANTSKRVKFGKEINAKKGRVPNIVYGYNKIKGDYFNLKINEVEADIIKRIFKLYIDGGYGANKIASILNSENIKTKRGNNFSQNAIVRILTNEIYIGKIINGKEEVEDFLTSKRVKKDTEEWHVVENESIKIIDIDTFEKARKILNSRNDKFKTKGHRQNNKHLFSTLIKCKCCGYSFRRVERKYKNTYTYWVCSGRNINGVDSCKNKTKLYENNLKEEIEKYFIEILNTKNDVVKNIVTEFDKAYNTQNDNKNIEKELHKKMERLQKSRKKYMEMYEDDIIDMVELKQKVSELKPQIQKLESELRLIQHNILKGDKVGGILNDAFREIKSIMNLDNMSNAGIKNIIEKMEVEEDGKIDVYLKMLQEIGLNNNVLISDNYT